MQRYQVIELIVDINPQLKKGMKGVILEIWDADTYEVEFVDDDATNIEFEGMSTFTLKTTDMKPSSISK
jgi:hypothetical protein